MNLITHFSNYRENNNTSIDKMDKDFYQSIFDLVKLIPKGRVCSYGLIARSLGSPQASRVVGYAMNKSHLADPKIPAHRVVNRLGILSGKHHFAKSHRTTKELELCLKE